MVLFCFANRHNTFGSSFIFVYEDSSKVIHITNTKYLNDSELIKIIQKLPSEKRPDTIKDMLRCATEDGDIEELKRIIELFNINNENQVNGLIDSANRKVVEQQHTNKMAGKAEQANKYFEKSKKISSNKGVEIVNSIGESFLRCPCTDIENAEKYYEKTINKLEQLQDCPSSIQRGVTFYLTGCLNNKIKEARSLKRVGDTYLGCSAAMIDKTQLEEKMGDLEEQVQDAQTKAINAQAAASNAANAANNAANAAIVH